MTIEEVLGSLDGLSTEDLEILNRALLFALMERS